MYGWHARIGRISPSPETVVAEEWPFPDEIVRGYRNGPVSLPGLPPMRRLSPSCHSQPEANRSRAGGQ